ncbi:hypothetical protein E2C01_085091 [Portunus trituberculatus]|uniref:Uncharacterized protein n=1 Tax=Portunus trituberculatus TaxID=210409 RepID=A0A5B7IX08_PORTR|nr:hypothetical protein [Portunus trituberculatus]
MSTALPGVALKRAVSRRKRYVEQWNCYILYEKQEHKPFVKRGLPVITKVERQVPALNYLKILVPVGGKFHCRFGANGQTNERSQVM